MSYDISVSFSLRRVQYWPSEIELSFDMSRIKYRRLRANVLRSRRLLRRRSSAVNEILYWPFYRLSCGHYSGGWFSWTVFSCIQWCAVAMLADWKNAPRCRTRAPAVVRVRPCAFYIYMIRARTVNNTVHVIPHNVKLDLLNVIANTFCPSGY